MPGGKGQTIAQAYVQILPSTEGIQGQLSSALDPAAAAAGAKSGGKFSGAFKAGLATVGKAALAAGAAASAAVVAMGKQALDSYADYEQLVGGVETLFKDSADTVQQYAAAAYQTAGLSANEYMETVTGFSASLLQSLDGDTAKAAQVADMAITDMADNANKMGSSMESIQNAYQGFAKQNYTMLDNLKLGYGGTKSEMERLLADAEKLTGIHYDIDSLSDVYEAIHAIQVEMDITGTTAKEASDTISGSVAMTKAAWSNLLTGIADENANLDQLVDNFVNSAVTAGENLLPRISVILEGAGKLVGEGAEKLIPIAVDALIDNLPQLIESGVRLVAALITGLIKAIPKLVASTPQIIASIVRGFVSGWPSIRQAGSDMINQVKQAFMEKVNQARQWGRDLVQNFIDGILAKFSALKDSVKSVASTIKKHIGFSEPEEGPLSNFHEYAPDMMDLFAQGIRQGETRLREQLRQSFDFGPQLRPAAFLHQVSAAAESTGSSGSDGWRVRSFDNQTMTVVLQLNEAELGRAVYRLNNQETQRVGVRLAGGAMA